MQILRNFAQPSPLSSKKIMTFWYGLSQFKIQLFWYFGLLWNSSWRCYSCRRALVLMIWRLHRAISVVITTNNKINMSYQTKVLQRIFLFSVATFPLEIIQGDNNLSPWLTMATYTANWQCSTNLLSKLNPCLDPMFLRNLIAVVLNWVVLSRLVE
jgi:hypothetical protein